MSPSRRETPERRLGVFRVFVLFFGSVFVGVVGRRPAAGGSSLRHPPPLPAGPGLAPSPVGWGGWAGLGLGLGDKCRQGLPQPPRLAPGQAWSGDGFCSRELRCRNSELPAVGPAADPGELGGCYTLVFSCSG